jgi:hypothetical protein
MDDLTKEVWQGVATRAHRPDPVALPPSPVTETSPPVKEETGWREFLVSRKLGAIYALACILGVLAIVSAHPFASASVSERVSDNLGQPATCTESVGTVTGESGGQTIYRCAVGKRRLVECFAVSGRNIRQVSGRRELGC